MKVRLLVLSVLSAALLAGLVGAASAQPPPPAAAAGPPQIELAGVGKLETLPDVADGDWVLYGKLTPDDPGALRLTAALLYQDKGDHYELRLSGKEAQFFLVRGGKAAPLGRAGDPGDALKAGQMTEMAVRRDGWNLSLLLGGRLICAAQDHTLQTGRVGYALTASKIAEPLLQFLGDMGFEDDFMRAEGEKSHWQPVGGTWAEESLRIDPQASTMQEARSSNAFSYLGKSPQGRALSIAGYWFWSNYQISASVRPLGAGACGLLAYYRDPDNYLALRWTPRNSTAPDANRLQIVQRFGGQEKVLAETPGGFRPAQWYKLGIALNGSWVRAYLDDEERLSAHSEVMRQGKCGLLEEGAEGVNFDDVILTPWAYFADDFDGSQRWDVASGKWERESGRYNAGGAGVLAGPPCDWTHYAMDADAHVEKGAAGVVFGYVDSSNYWLARYNAGANRAELVQISGGDDKVVASAPVKQRAGLAQRVSAEVNENLVTVSVGTERLLRAMVPSVPAGRVGLYSSAGGNWFSFAENQRLDPPAVAHVTKEFLDDKEHWEMAQWATRRSPWAIPEALQVAKLGEMVLMDVNSPAEYGNNLWWSKADYFGDKVVSFKIPAFGLMTGTARVILDTHPDEKGQPIGGYTLTLAAKAGSKALGLTLTAGEKPLGQATVNVEDQECKIDYSRSGQFLQVRVNDKLVIQATVSE